MVTRIAVEAAERGVEETGAVFENQQALGEFLERFLVVGQPHPSLYRDGRRLEMMAGTSLHLSSSRSRCRRRFPLVREGKRAIPRELSRVEQG